MSVANIKIEKPLKYQRRLGLAHRVRGSKAGKPEEIGGWDITCMMTGGYFLKVQ